MILQVILIIYIMAVVSMAAGFFIGAFIHHGSGEKIKARISTRRTENEPDEN